VCDPVSVTDRPAEGTDLPDPAAPLSGSTLAFLIVMGVLTLACCVAFVWLFVVLGQLGIEAARAQGPGVRWGTFTAVECHVEVLDSICTGSWLADDGAPALDHVQLVGSLAQGHSTRAAFLDGSVSLDGIQFVGTASWARFWAIFPWALMAVFFAAVAVIVVRTVRVARRAG